MTDEQKQQIIALRRDGAGYGRIAARLQISINTVKSFCRRHSLAASTAGAVCEQCGKPIEQNPGRKRKRFCCDVCRNKWWNAHLELRSGGGREEADRVQPGEPLELLRRGVHLSRPKKFVQTKTARASPRPTLHPQGRALRARGSSRLRFRPQKTRTFYGTTRRTFPTPREIVDILLSNC